MNIHRLAFAALVLPAALAAQTPPAAPQANPITTAFRTRILSAHRNIAQALDSIPATKFDYKPTPAQLTRKLPMLWCGEWPKKWLESVP